MVDANFGYEGRLDLLADFIRETAAANLFWLDEMIPSELAGYRRLRELQAEHCPDTLLTAGEVDRDPPSGVFPALIEERLTDGYQPDILGVGLLRWQELDGWLAALSVSAVPHSFHNGNFGRQVGMVFGAASRTGDAGRRTTAAECLPIGRSRARRRFIPGAHRSCPRPTCRRRDLRSRIRGERRGDHAMRRSLS